jgi:hypothetical protein
VFVGYCRLLLGFLGFSGLRKWRCFEEGIIGGGSSGCEFSGAAFDWIGG